MREAVIVDVARTPFGRGRPGGALAGVHPVELLAGVLGAVVARNRLEACLVEDVIAGCVLQVGEQAGNIARNAALAAGFPATVPGVTIDRKCGSSQQALHFAAQGVIAGVYDIVIAAGVESMSTIPMRTNRMGRDALGPTLTSRLAPGPVSQGISAELIAARWGLARQGMDDLALASHRRAIAAEEAGYLAGQLAPVRRADGRVVTSDEGPRRDTSAAKLSALAPAFADEAIGRRFPEITWSVTAGNSSQVTDGASAALVMDRGTADRLGLRARAVVRAFSVVGDDPFLMLTGVIPATRRLLERAGLTVADVDTFEVNEAFASVVLAWAHELDVGLERVNEWGGAIAVGHPAGASGLRLLGNVLGVLEHREARFGAVVMCESGGMANATLFERLGDPR
jgi:acetyl-CoA acetyltransferase family protein